MTFKLHTLINVERELVSYLPDDLGKNYKAAFALHLSAELIAEDKQESDSQKLYKDWLNNLKKICFYVCEKNGETAQNIKKIDPNSILPSSTEDINNAGLFEWLCQWQPDWVRSEQGAHVDLDDGYKFSASELLRSTASWIAPVPQSTGLTRIILLCEGEFSEDKDMFIFASWNDISDEGATLTVTTNNEDPQQIEVIRPSIPGAANPTEYVRTVLLPGENSLPSTLDTSGFFKVASSVGDKNNTDDDYRVIRRFQERAASALWTLPQLLDVNVEKLEEFRRNASSTDHRWYDFVVAATATALDPILIALMMPGVGEENSIDTDSNNDSSAEGQLLATLVSISLHKWAEVKIADNEKTNEELKQKLNKWIFEKFVSKIRDILEKSKPYFSRFQKDDPAKALALALIKDLDLQSSDALYKTLAQDRTQKPFVFPSVTEVLASLRQLLVDIQQESGTEKCVLKILDKEFLIIELLKELYKYLFGDAICKLDSTELERFLSDVFDEFKNTILGDYDGAEAVRRSCSQVFLNLQLKDENKIGTDLTNRLKDSLQSSRFFDRRLNRDTVWGLPLEPIVTLLWNPRFSDNELAFHCKLKLEAVIENLFPSLTGAERRFIPDSTPMPLPIQIAPSTNARDMAIFQESFQGVGVLIQREKEGWRHACLVDLKLNYPEGKDAIEIKNSLQSLMLVANDQHQPMFLEYHGFPLASPAFNGINTTEGQRQDWIKRFYELKDIGAPDSGPPALAYGKTYKVASFAVSQAGVLPKGIRRTKEDLWLPKTVIIDNIDNPAVPIYSQQKYLRRTAIGRIDIRHPDNATASERRIGVSYPDVYPLSLDYPRVAVGCDNKYKNTLDLFRNSDGTGGIDLSSLSSDNPITLELNDLNVYWGRADGVSTKLKVSLYLEANIKFGTQEEACDEIDLKPIDRLKIVINLQSASKKKIVSDQIELGVPDQFDRETATAWLRLNILDNKSVCLSLARPETDQFGKRYSNDAAPPILLLADCSDTSVWKRPFNQEFYAMIDLPRVGFLDFEHWVANKEQLIEHIEDKNLNVHFINILTAAYLLRDRNQKLAAILDRLPDPAVRYCLVEFEPLHSITIPNSKFLSPPAQLISLCSVSNLLPTDFDIEAKDWDQIDPLAFFEKIDERLHWKLQCKCDPESPPNIEIDEENRVVKITLPKAVAGNVWIRPLVLKSFFDFLIDGRMKEHACGEYTKGEEEKFLVFQGTGITIETFADFKTSSKETSFEIVPAGSERVYDIITKTQDLQVSHIESFTQRWRFSGRPIYNWIKPREYNTSTTKSAALPILQPKTENLEELMQFEDELFLERDSADAASVLTRLEPFKDSSVLQRIVWREPSATWFRHRFRLWSRYRGAMLNQTESYYDTWEKKTDKSGASNYLKKWTLRVAMLADPTNLQLTRPQLRALIPLTRSPYDALNSEKAVSPPLTCIMEERPFAFGGLADRVLSGITSGIGYGFPEIVKADSTVTPQDLKKQISPDPRFSLQSMEENSALGATFITEGPIGLHFDRTDVSAPAWSNSQHLLHPVILSDPQKSYVDPETFLGVQMLRMLDPDWVFASDAKNGNDLNGNDLELDLSRNWLIHVYEADSSSSDVVSLEIEDVAILKIEDLCVAKVQGEAGKFNVLIKPCMVDETASNHAKMLKLCKVDKSIVKDLWLVYQAKSGVKGTLHVLVRQNWPSYSDSQKQFDSRMLLASIDWAVPGKTVEAWNDFQWRLEISGKNISAQPLHLSSTTTMQWARTAKPSDVVHALDDDSHELTAHMVDNLSLCPDKVGSYTVQKKGGTTPLWLVPVEEPSHLPRSVHRHLVGILTSSSEGIGRRVDEYVDAILLTGKEIKPSKSGTPTITGLRIAELHVPARSLVAGNSINIHEKFTNPFFDVYALHPETAQSFHFCVRFLYAKNGLSNVLFPVSLKLTPFLDGGSCGNFMTLEIESVYKNKMRELDIWISKSSDNNFSIIKWRLRGLDDLEIGGIIKKDSEKPQPQANNLKLLGFKLEMSTKKGAGELWADVSMLPSNRSINGFTDHQIFDQFDFDWVFSAQGGDSNFGQAVDPKNLQELREVAAQLVSLSPPIRRRV